MNKIAKVFILSIILSFIACSNVLAIGQLFGDAEDWIDDGVAAGDAISITTMNQISTDIYNILFGVGIVIIFAVGAFLGIKFITTGVEEKAEVKEALIPYLISGVVFFGAFGVWKLAVTILGGLA